jgi:hypothetical protein
MNPLAASTLWQLGSSWRKNALNHVCKLREPIRNALDRRVEVFLTVSHCPTPAACMSPNQYATTLPFPFIVAVHISMVGHASQPAS